MNGMNGPFIIYFAVCKIFSKDQEEKTRRHYVCYHHIMM